MKFDFITDLHIDNNNTKLDFKEMKSNDADVLLIGGDISNTPKDLESILLKAKKEYKEVIFIDGNHEWYNCKQSLDAGSEFLEFLAEVTDTIYLNGKDVVFGDTVVIGANGWYDFLATDNYSEAKKAFKENMNDYKMFWQFEKFSPDIIAIKQAMELEFLVQKYQDDNNIENIIMLTHTAPLKELTGRPGVVEVDHLDGSFSNITMGKNVLKADVNKKIKAWCYGHTHTKRDLTINDIRFINNARGYYFENNDKPYFPVKVDTEELSLENFWKNASV